MQKVAEGGAFAHELMFTPDLPSGVISFKVRGNDGTVILEETITPLAGALSLVLRVPGSYATVGDGRLFESRLLSWEFETINGTVTGSTRYRIDAYLAFGVSTDGVRNKLGVLEIEVPDEDIDLIAGFLDFSAPITDTVALQAAATSGDRTAMIVIDAIEAAAALMLLPTMRVKIAKDRSSGTNSFGRDTKIDWDAIGVALSQMVTAGQTAVTPAATATTTTSYPILAFSTRATDAITGV